MDTDKFKTRVKISIKRRYPNSFLEFWANLFNFTGSLYEYETENTNDSDVDAMIEDWQSVGDDIRSVMADYKKEVKKGTLQR